MTAPAPRTKLTYEDYLLFPEDGKCHELMDGEHYMTPAPTPRHQRISRNLLVLLHTFAKAHRLGEVLDAPCDIRLSDVDVVQPDLLFIAAARSSIIEEKYVRGSPDLAIEILSDTTRNTDERTKRGLYEKFGVPEYWIVDPQSESITVYRLSEGRYVRASAVSKRTKERLTTPLLPGLELPLDEIFG